MPSPIELGCADPANPCSLPNSMAADPYLKQVVAELRGPPDRGAGDGVVGVLAELGAKIPAVAERALQLLADRFQDAAARPARGVDKVEALGRAYVAFAHEFPHYFAALARFETHLRDLEDTGDEPAGDAHWQESLELGSTEAPQTLLVRGAPAFVADTFCASRLAPEGSFNYGALPRGVDVQAIIDRATPRMQ